MTAALIKSNWITPIGTVAVCINQYCKHTEITISEIIPKTQCTKCKSEALLVTSAFINEPYLQIKDKMLDLHVLLYSYIVSKITQEYIDNEQVPNLRCFVTSYIKRTGKEEREVDTLIYSTKTKKVLPIEIKMHQNRCKQPRGRLRDILKSDLKQLADTIEQIGLERGCYITNLIISDEEIQDIKEKLIPKIFEKEEIEIISATDEKQFLKKIDELIDEIQK